MDIITLRKTVEVLYDEFGRDAAAELRADGQHGVASRLDTTVQLIATAKDDRKAKDAATHVVDAAWALLHTSGWTSSCWREAYCLAQVCRALLLLLPLTATQAERSPPAARNGRGSAAGGAAAAQPRAARLAAATSADAPAQPANAAASSSTGDGTGIVAVARGRTALVAGLPHQEQEEEQRHDVAKQQQQQQQEQEQRQDVGEQQQQQEQEQRQDVGKQQQQEEELGKQQQLQPHPARAAVQALDMAVIMGLPGDLAEPFLQVAEPLAARHWLTELGAQHAQRAQQAQGQQGGGRQSVAPGSAAAAAAGGEGGGGADRQLSTATSGGGGGGGEADWQVSAAAVAGRVLLPSAGMTPAPGWPALGEGHAVPRVSIADLDPVTFRKEFWKADRPVIITGMMDGWPALSKWRDIEWWVRTHGHRTIPVELGLDGTQGWREATMTLADFMTRYMVPSCNGSTSSTAGACPAGGSPAAAGSCVSASTSGAGSGDDAGQVEAGGGKGTGSGGDAGEGEAGVAYLAQHPLFDQIASLADDVRPPPLCGPQGPLICNVWLGTAATVTPCHFDSYDNFLAGVAGYKYLRLYAASETPYLYVDRSGTTTTNGGGDSANNAAQPNGASPAPPLSSTRSQRNVSSVDVERPDLQRFPLFAHAHHLELVLAPGEALFMPAGTWHYVRSLTPAASVNFWF